MKGTQMALMIVGEVISFIVAVCCSFVVIPVMIAVFKHSDPEGQVAGIFITLWGFSVIINVILCIIGRRTANKVALILNIIFGFFSGIIFNAIGAIMGLCAANNNNRKGIE